MKENFLGFYIVTQVRGSAKKTVLLYYGMVPYHTILYLSIIFAVAERFVMV